MTWLQLFGRLGRVTAVAAMLGAVLLGCAGQPEAPRLRIANQGKLDIDSLTVIFPEDRIVYTDIAADSTTEYREVPHGVYGYAAYQVEVDGQFIELPVIDWVGEGPMLGDDFTYSLDVDPARSRWQVVQVIQVTRDK